MQAMFIGGSAHGQTMEVSPDMKDYYVQPIGSETRELYYRKHWSTGRTTVPFFALHTLSEAEIDAKARPLLG